MKKKQVEKEKLLVEDVFEDTMMLCPPFLPYMSQLKEGDNK